MRPHNDALPVQLMTVFVADFLELFVPQVLSDAGIDKLTIVEGVTVEDIGDRPVAPPDIVVRAEAGGRTCHLFLVQIENQSFTNSSFVNRMSYYVSQLLTTYGVRVYPIAVFTYDTVPAHEPDSVVIRIAGTTIMEFAFRKIQLRALSWRTFLDKHNPMAAALMVKMRFEGHERALVKAACVRLLASLALDPMNVNTIGRFIEAHMRLDAKELEEYNEIITAMAPAEQQAMRDVLLHWG